MNNAELLENYSKRLGSTGKTRTLYLRYAKDFLDYVEILGYSLDRYAIDKYLMYLRNNRKYHDGSINLIFRIIRTLFKRNEVLLKEQNIEWPFNRGESPQIREDRILAPALDPDIIGEMVQAVKENGEQTSVEGCRSIPGRLYLVRRPKIVKVKGMNLDGEGVAIKGHDLLATVLKHEVDHLDGVLIDSIGRLIG